jgi:signal transduction histidine kinase
MVQWKALLPDWCYAALASRANAVVNYPAWLSLKSLSWWETWLPAMCFVLDLLFVGGLVSPTDNGVDTFNVFVSIGFGLIAYVGLIWRHQMPLPVFTFIFIYSSVSVVFVGYFPALEVLLALYVVSLHCSVHASVIASVGTILLGVYGVQLFEPGLASFHPLFLLLVIIMTASVGRWVRVRRQHAQDLKRLRDAQAREAVAAERVRIARELHDIVAHSVTIMILQAAGAQRVISVDTNRASLALTEVEKSGKQAMGELRRMLTVLRADDTGDVKEGRQDLTCLDGLITGFAASGLEVGIDVHGVPSSLGRSVGLTAYRVIQESLTNVSKHAGPGARATVDINWTVDRVLIRVQDDGRGTPSPIAAELSTGHGLIGLEERLHAIDGDLTFGPRPIGGFEVIAALPIIVRERDMNPPSAGHSRYSSKDSPLP